MRENQSIQCPFCGEKSVVKRKTVLDGFRVVGAVPVCLLCGARLGDFEAPPGAGAAPVRSSGALAALLGETTAAPRPVWAAAPEEKRFCRDCAHYIKHPFLSRCTRHDREVNPMDDCPEWARQETGKQQE